MRSAFLVAALAGCYSPTIASGVPCSEDFACPRDQVCDRSASPPTCSTDPVSVDGGTDDSAPDVAPSVRWSTPRVVMQPVGEEDDPTLTGDMLELFFNRNQATFWHVRRDSPTAAWGAPERVFALGRGTSPELTPDGRTIYFGSDRAGTAGGDDVWTSTRVDPDAPWTAPMRVGELSSATDDSSAAPSADNLAIVFTRFINNARGVDLMASKRATVNDPWEAPVALRSLSSSDADGDPMLSADGLTLYFYSTRTGNGDLYTATRASLEEDFGEPQPITELNLPGSLDQDPWVSPDGRHMFFASDRSGQMTIYETTR